MAAPDPSNPNVAAPSVMDKALTEVIFTANASKLTEVEAALPIWIVLADAPLPIFILPVSVSDPILIVLLPDASIVIAPDALWSYATVVKVAAPDPSNPNVAAPSVIDPFKYKSLNEYVDEPKSVSLSVPGNQYKTLSSSPVFVPPIFNTRSDSGSVPDIVAP